MRQRFTQLIRPQTPRAKRQLGALVLLPLSFSALADVTLNTRRLINPYRRIRSVHR
jgi:hypothetical protein